MPDEPTLPAALLGFQGEELENYVRARIRHFARRFATRINPMADANAVEEVLESVLDEETEANVEVEGTRVERENSPEEANRSYKLKFFHWCQNIGCRQPNCQLCKNNPDVVCEKDFAKSYYIGDSGKFTAACRANILVKLVEEGSGEAATLQEDLAIELWALEGTYTGEDFDAHIAQGENSTESFMTLGRANQPICLTIPANESVVEVPANLTFTRGSERLDAKIVMLCARASGQLTIPIQEARSDTFRVLTRRSRLSLKPDRPSMEASVKNLCCIGDKTFEKLQNLKEECAKQNLDLDFTTTLPGPGVTTVREFCRMSGAVEMDPVLKDRLLRLLGMSEENWAEANRHASSAVIIDNVNRVWVHDDVALVYKCILGKVDLSTPIEVRCSENVYLPENMDPSEWSSWCDYHDCACQCWFAEGHPGWRRAMHSSSSHNSSLALSESTTADRIETPPPRDPLDDTIFVEDLLRNLDVEGASSSLDCSA